jgi:hypothetical protein
LITTCKHELRGHGRPLNQNFGRRRGSGRGSRDELGNAYEEADAEQPRKKSAFWNDAFQGIKLSAIRLSTSYVETRDEHIAGFR